MNHSDTLPANFDIPVRTTEEFTGNVTPLLHEIRHALGALLENGKPHDGRAPDYDDWITVSESGKPGLNGDIVVWNPVIERHFELSSMGIRVDRESLLSQLELRGVMERKDLWWHRRLLDDDFPLSIGGGIGQSRLCMFYLRKAHIGEVQSSVWPNEMRETCAANNIFLL